MCKCYECKSDNTLTLSGAIQIHFMNYAQAVGYTAEVTLHQQYTTPLSRPELSWLSSVDIQGNMAQFSDA